MAKQKYYAIKEGYDSSKEERVQDIIVYNWADCQKYIKGVKGAIYKSFTEEDEARKFLKEGSKLLRKSKNDVYPTDCLHIYVDGSCNSEGTMFSYGVVAVRDGVVEYIESDAGKSSTTNNVRQIAGELKGALQATRYAISKGEPKIVLFHDYEGICHHATGFWERKDKTSERYYDLMQELIKKIDITFVQVNSHQGDLFNELVDSKCKQCLDIKNDKSVEKWLSKNTITALNHDIKQQIIEVISSGEDNILIVGEDNIEKEVTDAKIVKSNEKDITKEITSLLKKLSPDKKEKVLEYIKSL